ncbi:MAG TPA: FG-GAP-like repeat-containing protein, partial [Methylotenera sp.]|nr:FG-GAP-like repeat-containing protein [Methylotenera sp.]
DIDGDGYNDVSVVNRIGGTVSVLRNSGIGSLLAKQDFATAATPEALAIGDINGDGKPDLAVANNGSNSMSALVNSSTSGSVSFAAKADFTTGSTPQGIAIADLDSDGKSDIAVANLLGNSVSVFRNTPQFSNNANLAGLSISGGALNPAFAAATTAYTVTAYNPLVLMQITATVAQANATLQLRVNGGAFTPLNSGSPSFLTGLNQTINTVEVKVTAQNLVDTKTYMITLTLAYAPTITSLTPASGNVGSNVTIAGTNFSAVAAGNTVFFGATKATVTQATANSLTVTVPAGASYAPVSVTNNSVTQLMADSRARFNPTFSPSKASIGTEDFAPKVDFASGTDTRYVVVGDVDGDGKPDMVASNPATNIVSVLRNTSTSGSITAASFAAKVDFAITAAGISQL